MSNFFIVLQFLASLVPVITQCIKAVEDAIPQPGQGPAKLQMVRGMLESAYTQVTDAKVTFDQLWPMAQVMITNLVLLYNAIGIFKKATK